MRSHEKQNQITDALARCGAAYDVTMDAWLLRFTNETWVSGEALRLSNCPETVLFATYQNMRSDINRAIDRAIMRLFDGTSKIL